MASTANTPNTQESGAAKAPAEKTSATPTAGTAPQSPQATNAGKLRITYVKSVIGYNHKQRDTITALGLHRLHQSVEHTDTPEIRGMVNRVSHLVRVEEVAG